MRCVKLTSVAVCRVAWRCRYDGNYWGLGNDDSVELQMALGRDNAFVLARGLAGNTTLRTLQYVAGVDAGVAGWWYLAMKSVASLTICGCLSWWQLARERVWQ